jgi:hypothetical protein
MPCRCGQANSSSQQMKSGDEHTLFGVGVLMVPLPDVVVLVAGVVAELDAGVEVDVPGVVELDVVLVSLAPDVMGTAGPSTETQI